MTEPYDPQTDTKSAGPQAEGMNVEHQDALGSPPPKVEEASGSDLELARIHPPSLKVPTPFKIVNEVNSFVKNAMASGPQEEQEYETPLPEDIFSLIYVCADWSAGFFFSVLIFFVQMGIIVLILFDLVDPSSDHNPLKMPPGVDLQVSIAQGVAMVLAAATQTNLLTAISRMALFSSYDHKYVVSIFPDATKRAYKVSFTLQFIAGFCMLVCNFVLNMQSTTVLGLMLNFAALAFISEIQETAFWVARHGYISISLQEATLQVINFHIPKQHRKDTNTMIKRFCFVVIVAGMLAYYAVLVRQQRSGVFICNKLMVQFGDEFRPDLAFFSDVFVRTGTLVSGRDTYVDEKTRNSTFAYCASEQVWTFSGPYDFRDAVLDGGNITVQRGSGDPCSYWIKSRPTSTYDITETLSNGWIIYDYFSNQSLPMDHLFLECNDCEGGRATQSCSGHGSCSNNTCVCNERRIGVNCEYNRPCKNLELDLRTEPFPYASGGTFRPSTSYELLLNNESEPVMVYNKPVYYSYLSTTKIPLNVLLFTGRRYGLFLNTELHDATELEQLRDGLPRYLPEFHSWFSKHRVYFFTDPMDAGTPTDASTPVNLNWYRARKLLGFRDRTLYRIDNNQPTGTILLCPECQVALNDCLNDGHCTVDNSDEGSLFDFLTRSGSCECQYGFEGHLCEKDMSCFHPNATCLNGGNCTIDGSCSCTDQFAGKLCQYELSEWYVDLEESLPEGSG